MKANFFPLLNASVTLALVSPAFSIEAPEDDSPPPAANQKASALPEIKLPPANKPAVAQTAFLGIVTNEVPDMLASHLGLKRGEGVMVRSLVPDGPATKAGLAVHDVITRVAGTPVGSPQDVSAQVTAHKPGDAVVLDLIHQGKATELKVTLGTKPEEIAGMEPQALDPLQLDGIPNELADRIRKAIEGNLGGLDLRQGDNQAGPELEEAMGGLLKRMQGAMGQGFVIPGADDSKDAAKSAATLKMADAQGSVEVKSNEGSKEVTIRDKEDKVTWKGPWDTAQDKQAAPPDVRQRVESLNIDSSFKGQGLRLNLNPPAKPQE